jgi:hypothetical protein
MKTCSTVLEFFLEYRQEEEFQNALHSNANALKDLQI